MQSRAKKSSRPKNAKPLPIPKRIHYIWLGGPIPEKYLLPIAELARVAERSGFKINLWVDHPANYETTVNKIQKEREFFQIPHLRVRQISELLPKMEIDPFYLKKVDLNKTNLSIKLGEKLPLFYNAENRLQQFILYINREMIGCKNLAAASDLLRYEILRQYGGYYFDTDTEFKLSRDSRLKTERPELGIKANIDVSFSSSQKNNKYWISEIGGNNDIIAVLPNHPVLEKTISKCLDSYNQKDQQQAGSWQIKRTEEISGCVISNIAFKLSGMDLKRLLLPTKEGSILGSIRAQDTLFSSGPGPFCKAIFDYLTTISTTLTFSLSVCESLFLKDGLIIAIQRINSDTHLTWLNSSLKKQAFDTGSIPGSIDARHGALFPFPKISSQNQIHTEYSEDEDKYISTEKKTDRNNLTIQEKNSSNPLLPPIQLNRNSIFSTDPSISHSKKSRQSNDNESKSESESKKHLPSLFKKK